MHEIHRTRSSVLRPSFCQTKNEESVFTMLSFLLQPLKDVSEKVEKGYRMEIPDGCPKAMYTLMQRCWNIDPLRRPSFKEMRRELERETVL